MGLQVEQVAMLAPRMERMVVMVGMRTVVMVGMEAVRLRVKGIQIVRTSCLRYRSDPLSTHTCSVKSWGYRLSLRLGHYD